MSTTTGSNKKLSFEDRTLLRIRRDFSESEAVQFVIQENDNLKIKLSQYQIKSGEMKSEIAELKYQKEKILKALRLLEKSLKIAEAGIKPSNDWKDVFQKVDRLSED